MTSAASDETRPVNPSASQSGQLDARIRGMNEVRNSRRFILILFFKYQCHYNRCSFSMMVKRANDYLLQANDGKMLVNDGEMLVNDGEMLVNDGEMSI